MAETDPWGEFAPQTPDAPGPVTVGKPRPPKREIREVGGSLGVVDPNTGSFTPTYTPPKDTTAKDPNGTQGMAAGFYGRALYANNKYGKGVPPRDPVSQGIVNMLPQGIANSMSGHDRQLANTFAKDFVAATLRKESGAAISPEEYENQLARYFPMPGDSEDTIQAKARLRDTAIESLRNQAGPAAADMDSKIHRMLQEDDATGRFGDNFGASGTDVQFGDEPKGPRSLTPEQQKRDQAFLASNPTPDQYAAFLAGLIDHPVDKEAAAARLKAAQEGGAYNPGVTDPRVDEDVQRRLKNRSGGSDAAVIGAATDIPGISHLASAADAGVRALTGQGDFGDLYNVSLQATHGYEDALRKQYPLPYIGGQIAGGVLLPAAGARTAGQLARLGAAYGGATAADTGEGFGDVASRGFTGAVAGGAVGYGAGRLSTLLARKPSTVPELVDPATGSLNQPLEAMRPGQRVAAANQFDINLPMDAAGGRSAAIVGKGLDIMPGSAGVMEDARRATEEQVAQAAGKVADQFGSSRTLSEGGAELQRGAAERIERGKAVIGKAYEAIPIPANAGTALTNVRSALADLTSKFQSNPKLAAAMKDAKLDSYLEALTSKSDIVPTGILDASGKPLTRTVTHSGELSWKDLKDFRSRVGEMIGDYRFGEGHSTKDLRALYGALSEDMRVSAQAQGPQALRSFERANTLNRQNEELIDGALTRILGPEAKQSPEKAAAAVQAMTKGGKSTGDLKTLAQIRAATTKSGAWNEIASTLIRLGGQPANSAGRDFNPQTFVNWYADMAQPARNLLFGQGELRGALDQFVAVNQRLMKVNALRNTSNTTPNMIGAGLVGGAGVAAVSHPSALLVGAGAMGANFAMAKVWTNPGFVRWATGFAKASTVPAAKAQIGRLSKLAATNPELRAPLVSLQHRLLEAMNDNVTRPLAASQPDNGNEDQNNR